MKRLPLIILLIFALLIPDSRDTLGDVNDDGVINVLDIVRIVNIILENDPLPSDYELWASDVNIDETVNVQDIVIIVQVIMGTDDCPNLYSPCSDNLSLCCIDTTSHNFTWELDTLGSYGSVLMDVSIIDENNVWAVGEIRMSGDVLDRYNVAHWDGSTWELFRVTAPPYNIYNDKDCIFAFSQDDIWIANNKPLHWDGENWEIFLTPIYPYGMSWMNAIWGPSPTEVYFIHDLGNIAYYDGQEFISSPTGTTIRLRDIAGSTNSEMVFIVGWDESGENIVLKGNQDGWSELYYNVNYNPTDSTYGRLSSVDVIADTAYFSTVAGLWKYNYITQQSIILPASEINFVDRRYIDIAHNSSNDIMFFSAWFTFNHYNGHTWEYNESILDLSGDWNVFGRAIDMKNNFVVAVGKNISGGHAIVARGYRR